MTALKDLNASARDSALDLATAGVVLPNPDSLEGAVELAADGLKRPVHSFGVDQAFGAGAGASCFISSLSPSAVGFVTSANVSSAAAAIVSGSESPFLSGVALASRITLGRAGTTGPFGLCLGTGVVSPATETEACCEEGVVGFVEFSSDAG